MKYEIDIFINGGILTFTVEFQYGGPGEASKELIKIYEGVFPTATSVNASLIEE